jgi:hypothetical protein
MIKKFEETGSIMDSKLLVRHRTGRSLDNGAAVSESVAESPGISLRHRSQQLGIPRSTMQRILTKDMHMHAYKIHLTQELKPTDHVQREKFPGPVIPRNDDQDWPLRPCDLTLYDFLLWGVVRSLVYANKPQTVPEFKAEIRRVIGETEPQLCGSVIESFVKRARCASRVVGDICRILCSTVNLSVCTLY